MLVVTGYLCVAGGTEWLLLLRTVSRNKILGSWFCKSFIKNIMALFCFDAKPSPSNHKVIVVSQIIGNRE